MKAEPLARYLPASVRSWYQSDHGRKMVRYSMVSVVAVPVGEMGILMGLVFGMTPGWASIFGNSLGAFPSYYLNRSWVWGKTGRSHLMKEIVPFWTISAIGVLLAGWVGHWVGRWTTDHHWVGTGRAVLLLAANLVAFGVLWVGKYILFNTVLFRVRHHDVAAHTPAQAHEAGVAGAAGAPELD